MTGIIYIGDLKYAPFADKYINILKSEKEEYEVIYWERGVSSTGKHSSDPNYHVYRKKSKLNQKPIRKLRDFYFFKKWCSKIIASSCYDRLIILTTLSGFFIDKKILKKFENKYIFDIRDYSYENIGLFRLYEKYIIKNAFRTVISSPYFRYFLPRNREYIICHNCNEFEMQISKRHRRLPNEPINLGFLGSLRYFDYQRKIIEHLANDDRFEISYYGEGPEYNRYKQFKETSGIKNLHLYGAYDNSQKETILSKIDILNNSYGENAEYMTPEIKYALSNKYYDGLVFGIPQLVEVDSYKCKRVEKIGIGIGLNVNDPEFSNKLFEYYTHIDREQLIKNAKHELLHIKQDEENFNKTIKNFLKFKK